MIACPDCRTIQPVNKVNTGVLTVCPGCGAVLRADVFPSFHRERDHPAQGSDVKEQGEPECFNHPGKQAVVACSACGRLLCSLCEIRLEAKSLCLNCLQSGKDKKKISSLENRRTLFDNLALSLAFWPMLFIFPTLVTAPAVVFITVRYWREPGSVISRSRFRFVLALVLAVLQMAGWIVFFAGRFD